MKLDANGGDKTDPVEPRWVNERMRKDEQTEPAHRGTEGGIGSVTSSGVPEFRPAQVNHLAKCAENEIEKRLTRKFDEDFED